MGVIFDNPDPGRPPSKTQKGCLVLGGLALALTAALCAGFWRIGGLYGVDAMLSGTDPMKLTPTSPAGERESRKHGDRIIDAIYRYRKTKGAFPSRLEELVPEYTTEIEAPTVGDRKWVYQSSSSVSFTLHFVVGPTYENDMFRGGPEKGSWSSDR